jgi:hypothetical protein
VYHNPLGHTLLPKTPGLVIEVGQCHLLVISQSNVHISHLRFCLFCPLLFMDILIPFSKWRHSNTKETPSFSDSLSFKNLTIRCSIFWRNSYVHQITKELSIKFTRHGEASSKVDVTVDKRGIAFQRRVRFLDA